MNSDRQHTEATDNKPEAFARRFLEIRGAVVEPKPKGFDILLPSSLRRMLEVPEMISIRRDIPADSAESSSQNRTDEVWSVNYGSMLLEKMVASSTEGLPLVSCRLHFDYIKTGGFDRLVADTFRFSNARIKLENHAEVLTEYMLVNCWYQALSDEQKEGMFTLAFNAETGAAIPGMDEHIFTIQREFEPEEEIVHIGRDGIDALVPRLKTVIHTAVTHEIDTFSRNMNRRLRRDVGHLKEYYAGLKAEMEKSLERSGLSKRLVEERKEKIALIPEELAKKQDDLYNKYSIRVTASPMAVMRIKTPAVKLLARAEIGRASRNLSLIHNPVTKSVDPLVCEGCGHDTYTIRFCKGLHLTCPACGSDCPACGS